MRRRAFLATAASYARVLGANERVGVALIGSGRRGRDVMKAFLDTGRVNFACLCDIYDVQRERAKSALGPPQATCVAHEEALARRDVDAVLLATPDHLHLDLALATIKARKHLYLEKPAVHQLVEGAVLAAAVEATSLVCQVGTQQRSGAHYQRAKQEIFAKEKLGKVLFVRAVWSNFPWQARTIKPAPQPPGLDWDRFLGSSPKRPYDEARYDAWRYFPEYGGGVLADILNHWADVAQWMMDDYVPVDAVVSGGIYQLNDGRLNPDTVNAILRYPKNWNLTFESTVLGVENPRPAVEFVGTSATLDLARASYILRPNSGSAVEVKAESPLEDAHCRNFLDAIAGKAKLNAGVPIGLAGLLPCHMALSAYWTGKRARYDAATKKITT